MSWMPRDEIKEEVWPKKEVKCDPENETCAAFTKYDRCNINNEQKNVIQSDEFYILQAEKLTSDGYAGNIDWNPFDIRSYPMIQDIVAKPLFFIDLYCSGRNCNKDFKKW